MWLLYQLKCPPWLQQFWSQKRYDAETFWLQPHIYRELTLNIATIGCKVSECGLVGYFHNILRCFFWKFELFVNWVLENCNQGVNPLWFLTDRGNITHILCTDDIINSYAFLKAECALYISESEIHKTESTVTCSRFIHWFNSTSDQVSYRWDISGAQVIWGVSMDAGCLFFHTLATIPGRAGFDFLDSKNDRLLKLSASDH